MFPFGAWCMSRTLKSNKKEFSQAYIGYSQGRWFRVLRFGNDNRAGVYVRLSETWEGSSRIFSATFTTPEESRATWYDGSAVGGDLRDR